MSPGNLFAPLPYLMVGGRRRYLACLAPRDDFGGLPKFAAAPGTQVIPRSQWRAVTNRWRFGDAFILNQGEIGSCVANGSAAALRKSRLVGGQEDIALSPGALYAQINGGRDQGAIISDALTSLQQTGTCRYELVGEEPYYLGQLPAGWQQDAARFKIAQAYHCQSFDEIASAVQLDFLVVYGIMVAANFQSYDKYGVAGHADGPGNHCMHADGMTQLPDGRWVLDNANSWGASWGPFGNGRVYLDEEHFQHGDQPDAFAIVAATEDPQDPDKPPASLSAFGIHKPTTRTH